MKLELLTEEVRYNVIDLCDEIVEEYKPLYINPNRISGFYMPTQFDDFTTINLFLDTHLITVKLSDELREFLDNNIVNKKYD